MKRIIAIDFDGTIVENKYPEIGKPIDGAFEYMQRLQEDGYYLILWTCRSGELLKDAVDFCFDNGVIFDAVNESEPNNVECFNGEDTRKVFAHYYIDDRQIGGLPSWAMIYQYIRFEELILCRE